MIEAAQLRGQRPLFMETAEWECLVQERHVADNPALVEEGRRQLLDQLTEGLAADPAGTAAALRRLVEEETARLEELEAAHAAARGGRPVASWPIGWRWTRRRRETGCGGTSSIATGSCTGR